MLNEEGAFNFSLGWVCTVGLAHSSSKFYPWVAPKRFVPLDWYIPLLNFALGWLTICVIQMEASSYWRIPRAVGR